jgi:solute carrier family 25 (mitochondrial carnitine/acylcarnitine transporter), member 20/29
MLQEYSLSNEIVAGACAGVTGTVLGFPLDRCVQSQNYLSEDGRQRFSYPVAFDHSIKTRMQTHTVQPGTRKLTLPRAAGLIYAEGGLLSFYRGLAAPLLSLVILNTMTFSVYATLKEKYGVSKDTVVFGYQENLKVGLAAASVGPISALISTPFEMVKTQMQLSIKLDPSSGSSSTSRSSVVQAYRLMKQHGVRILYIGHGINMSREMLFLSTYFTVYENLKSKLSGLFPSSVAVPLAGGISGATGWFISYPLDCVKANIQGRNLQTDTPRSALKIARNLLETRGLLGLYAGLLPSIARAFLVSSSRFSAYELSMWLLR